MKTKPVSLFFLGKGGVGKSTCSALTAVAAAQKGDSVLLVSLDPAHNQSDIFKTGFNEKPKKITGNLLVLEIDQQKWVQKYLLEVKRQVKQSYTYLSAFNLEHYFDVIKFSPGIEEYALLMAYSHILKEHNDKDIIVFDMPPTALALKFFELPQISLIWLSRLLDLRNEILRKREIITTIKIGKTKIESDKITSRLRAQIEVYKTIRRIFSDVHKTRINLVLNPDQLSLNESRLIEQQLSEKELPINRLFLNKYDRENITEIKNSFSKIPMVPIPVAAFPLLGLDNLNVFLAAKESGIQDII